MCTQSPLPHFPPIPCSFIVHLYLVRKPAAPPGAKAALLGLGQKVQEAKAKTLMTTRAFHAGATSPGTKLKSIFNHVALERFPFAAYHSQGSEKALCVCVYLAAGRCSLRLISLIMRIRSVKRSGGQGWSPGPVK